MKSTIRTTEDKVSIAAQFLFTNWNEMEHKAVYHDDSTGNDFVCESESEMLDLYDLITSDDSDTRRDAYSIWCSQTSHDLL